MRLRYSAWFGTMDDFLASPSTKQVIAVTMQQPFLDPFIPGWYLFTQRGYGVEGPVTNTWEILNEDALMICGRRVTQQELNETYVRPIPPGYVFE